MAMETDAAGLRASDPRQRVFQPLPHFLRDFRHLGAVDQRQHGVRIHDFEMHGAGLVPGVAECGWLRGRSAMRLREIIAAVGYTDTLRSIADQFKSTDYW